MKRTFYLLLIVFITISCSSDDSSSTSSQDIKLITGLYARNLSGISLIELGNPNVHFNSFLNIYPNPAISNLNVYDETNNGISDVWLVKGNAQKIHQSLDFSSILDSNTFTETEIENNSEQHYTLEGSNNITINLENFDNGYYKVFIKRNGSIEWDNIYIGNNIDIDDLIEYWN